MIRLCGRELAAWFDALPSGPTDWRFSLDPGDQVDEPIKIFNVAGLLRGSDPALNRTCVIVSSHYDHLGTSTTAGDGDHIYNGANDDGSGTVSVIELAAAFARLEPRPRRSILFLTFFGEEMGLLGSRHYVKHPLLPLDQTIANVNLEQVGRTDDSEGSTSGIAMMTGVDYSQVADIFAAAGKATGVEYRHHPTKSDGYFTASDNAAFAQAGIPAHTICTAFQYPDYHGLGDHWDKIDYENMAKVDRSVALGLWQLANAEEAPTWNESPKTARFIEAWRKLHP
jgi:Zn-dependent M28 family amino/carboxypeptidase